VAVASASVTLPWAMCVQAAAPEAILMIFGMLLKNLLET
jgi:hypothetical protein